MLLTKSRARAIAKSWGKTLPREGQTIVHVDGLHRQELYKDGGTYKLVWEPKGKWENPPKNFSGYITKLIEGKHGYQPVVTIIWREGKKLVEKNFKMKKAFPSIERAITYGHKIVQFAKKHPNLIPWGQREKK